MDVDAWYGEEGRWYGDNEGNETIGDNEIESGAIRRRDRLFQGKAFWLLSTENVLRLRCIDLVTHPRFDHVILGVILINTILIAIDNPLGDEDTDFKKVMSGFDLAFMGIFALELVVKVIAMGFMSYMKDPWNVVDFTIVASGGASLFLSGSAIFSLLRIVKVFRPLRSINRVPGMKRLVNTLFSCLPLMFDVVCLSLLVFYLFSLVGVVMWHERLHHRCWMSDEPAKFNPNYAGYNDKVDVDGNTSSHWGRVCSDSSSIDAFQSQCPDGYACLNNAPPPYQYANFDHLGTAMLLVFQCVTLDGWITHSYNVEDGWSPAAAIFFVFLTMFGAYFVSNLVLAVVTDALSKYACDENATQPALTNEQLEIHNIEDDDEEDNAAEATTTEAAVVPHYSPPAVAFGQRGRTTSMFDRKQLRGAQADTCKKEWDNFVSGIRNQAINGIKQTIEEDYIHRRRAHTNFAPGEEDKLAMTLPTSHGETPREHFALTTKNLLTVGSLGKLERDTKARTGGFLDSSVCDTGRGSVDVKWREVRDELDRKFNKLGVKRTAVVASMCITTITQALLRRKGSERRLLQSSLKPTSRTPLTDVVTPTASGSRPFPPLCPPHKRRQLSSKPSTPQPDGLELTMRSDASHRNAFKSLTSPTGNDRNNLGFASAMSLTSAVEPYNPKENPLKAEKRSASPSVDDGSVSKRKRLSRSHSVASASTTVYSFASRSETIGKYTGTSQETTWWRVCCCFSPRWRHDLRQVCRSHYFNHTITGVILVNALMMGIEHYDMSEKMEAVLDFFNIIITFIFLAETTLKIVAYGLMRWSKDRYNLFDALVVLISLVELGFWESKAVSLFRVFRMFRVLRFLKLARSWNVLHKIVIMIQSSLEYIGYLVLLIFLFIFIFAVLGRSLFAGKLEQITWCSDMALETCLAKRMCEWQVSPLGVDTLGSSFASVYTHFENASVWAVPQNLSLTTTNMSAFSLFVFGVEMNEFNERMVFPMRSEVATNPVLEMRTQYDGDADMPQFVFPKAFLTRLTEMGRNYSFMDGDVESVYFIDSYTEAMSLVDEYLHHTMTSSDDLSTGRCREARYWQNFDNIQRANFDNLPWAALHVFQILTRDSWGLLCFKLMGEVSPFTVVYFLLILVFGTYLLFSMFIAILLVKLSEQTTDAEKRKKEKREKQANQKRRNSMVILEEMNVMSNNGGEGGRPATQPPPPPGNVITITPSASPLSPHNPSENEFPTEFRQVTTGGTRLRANTNTSNDPFAPLLSPKSPTSPATSPSPASRAMSPVTRTDVILYQMEKQRGRKHEIQRRKKMTYEERLAEANGVPLNNTGGKKAFPQPGSFYGNSFKDFKTKLAEPLGQRESENYNASSELFSTISECASSNILEDTAALITTPTFPRSALKGSRLKDTIGFDDKPNELNQTKTAVLLKPEAETIEDSQSAHLDMIDHFLEEVGVDKCYAESAEDSEDEWEQLRGKSFFIFSSKSKIRLWLTDRLITGCFERFVSYLIILNCVMLTLNDNTLGNNPDAILVVKIVDWVFTLIFSMEVLCRCIVYNCWIDEWSYLRRNQGWNKVDFFIVILSLVAMPIEMQGKWGGSGSHHVVVGTFSRMVKAFRAFRPLRILVRTKRMKVVVGAFVNTIPAVFNVMAVAFVLYFIFGVAGVQLMQGAFRRCSDGSDRSRAECIGFWNATELDGVYLTEEERLVGVRILEREWVNPRETSFDNLLASWMTLLEVAALSGWTEIMYAAVDSASLADAAPLRNNRPVLAVYFVAWIFAGAFFVMNIFTGVVVDHFTRQKLQLDGSIWLTDKQEEDLRVKRIIVNSKAKKRRSLPLNPNWFNTFCYAIVTHKVFPKFILICVLLNVALMATIHHDMNSDFRTAQSYGNTAFTIIFTVEMVLELGVAGPKHYYNFKWLRLDGCIVLLSWIEILISVIFTGGAAAAVIQILRLGRAFRLLRHFKGLRKLLMTLYYSIPAFYNISSLLFLMFFIFSVLGMALFEDVRKVDAEEVFPVLLSRRSNFETFPNAMLSLYRVATMDAWWRIVAGCQVVEPYCSQENDDCGNPIAASLYFSTFMLCVGFVMMNLFIAIILENFRESVLLPDDIMRKMESVIVFRELWAKYDPKGLQFIEASQFIPLLQMLLPPIGLLGKERKDILPTMKQLDFPITYPEQRVLFADAVDAIGEVVFDMKLVDSIATRKYLKMRYDMDMYGQGNTMAEYYAASVIQTAFRCYCIGLPVSGDYRFTPPTGDVLLKTIAMAKKRERNEDERRRNAPVPRAGPGPCVPLLKIGMVSRGSAQETPLPLMSRNSSSKLEARIASLPSFGNTSSSPSLERDHTPSSHNLKENVKVDESGVYIRQKGKKGHHAEPGESKLLKKYFEKNGIKEIDHAGEHSKSILGVSSANFSPTLPLSAHSRMREARAMEGAGEASQLMMPLLGTPLLGAPLLSPTTQALSSQRSLLDEAQHIQHRAKVVSPRKSPRRVVPRQDSWGSDSTTPNSSIKGNSFFYSNTAANELAMLTQEVNKHIHLRAEQTKHSDCGSDTSSVAYPFHEGNMIQWGTSAVEVSAVVYLAVSGCIAVKGVGLRRAESPPNASFTSARSYDDAPGRKKSAGFNKLTLQRMTSNSSSTTSMALPPKMREIHSRTPTPSMPMINAMSVSTSSAGNNALPASPLSAAPSAVLLGGSTPMSSPRGSNPSLPGRSVLLGANPPSPPQSFSGVNPHGTGMALPPMPLMSPTSSHPLLSSYTRNMSTMNSHPASPLSQLSALRSPLLGSAVNPHEKEAAAADLYHTAAAAAAAKRNGGGGGGGGVRGVASLLGSYKTNRQPAPPLYPPLPPQGLGANKQPLANASSSLLGGMVPAGLGSPSSLSPPNSARGYHSYQSALLN